MLIQQENMRFKTFLITSFIYFEIFFNYILKVLILCLQMSQLCVMHIVRMWVSVAWSFREEGWCFRDEGKILILIRVVLIGWDRGTE